MRLPDRLWIRLAQWCYATFTPSVSPIIESSRDGVGSATGAGFGGVVPASGIRHGVVVPSGDTAAAVTWNRALATHTKTVALGFSGIYPGALPNCEDADHCRMCLY